MEDYPNSDEEFEAMYADELELLRENGGFGEPPPKVAKALEFTKQSKPKVNVLQNITLPSTSVNQTFDNSFDRDFTPIPYDHKDRPTQNDTQASSCLSDFQPVVPESGGGEKRDYQSLFGDISDILDEDLSLPRPKRLKHGQEKNVDRELALIEHIVEMRRACRERLDPASTFGKNYVGGGAQNLRENLSYSAPKYSSVSVTRHDGSKVYVRFHSERFMKEERERVAAGLSFAGALGGSFKEVWKEAEILMANELESAALTSEITKPEEARPAELDSSMLWVDLYKPRKYSELLSDESTNRTMLRWLKLWDKVVFNRRPKMRVKVETFEKFQKQELNTELDEHGRPHYKIALLCGPPGLGKTTLAHMVARHAGYKVIEINASDERNADSFKTALDNATQMSSVIDAERRPNCLVFDEIDGAPQASIDFLIKYVTGAHAAKPKKGKKAKSSIVKRPIICICNDLYVPALRGLRQISFVVHFPSTSTARLASRLQEISAKEGMRVHEMALVALAEKSNNDVRSCLSVLHFFKAQNRPVTLTEVLKTSVGQKDVQRGLFSVWQDIFQIQRPKAKGDVVSLSGRWKKVLDTVSSFGDYERVGMGVFENYPTMNVKDSSLVGTCEALDWFCYSDTMSTKIQTTQNYSLGGYLQFAFILWHYVFASMQWCKITYPSVAGEVRAKTTKNKALVSEVLKGMRPGVRAYTSHSSVNLDILPILTEIISPSLRPVNLHLYTQQEKEQLRRIVNVMIDYNLNYTQERNQEGSYVFIIDPNIDDVVRYSTSKSKRTLSYPNRQLICHEIEVEKMRRLETSKGGSIPVADKKPRAAAPAAKPAVPNHLQRLKPKAVKGASKSGPKSFFLLTKPSDQVEDDTEVTTSNDIYYQFKEGHTNAVRKTVKVSQWF